MIAMAVETVVITVGVIFETAVITVAVMFEPVVKIVAVIIETVVINYLQEKVRGGVSIRGCENEFFS